MKCFLAAGVSGGGLVVDTSSNPPHLYVADTFNNRILGFRNALTVGTDANSLLTQKADLVIGEPDLNTSVVNYPTGNPVGSVTPNATGLNGPIGLVVDSSGNLYVADSGNGRVVRYPSPFNQNQTNLLPASLVLGQNAFNSTPNGLTGPANLGAPYGLAILSDGSLAVSDRQFNRVLIYRKNGADFTSGQTAEYRDRPSQFHRFQARPLQRPPITHSILRPISPWTARIICMWRIPATDAWLSSRR